MKARNAAGRPKRSMKILVVSSEAAPVVSVGGLADSVRALAIALAAAGHDVRVVLPRYGSIGPEGLKPLHGEISIPVGESDARGKILESLLPGSRIPLYFIDHPLFSERLGVYGSATEPNYEDSPERFALFCRGVFQLCRKLRWFPDIMSLHDWPSALCAVFLREIEAYGDFRSTASVLTIHNAGFQGIYGKKSFPFLRLPWECFHGSGFEDFERINILKAGVRCADAIATVSPTYAREIQTPEFGFRLDGLLRSRARDLVGILNGIDQAEWDPSSDERIAAKFSVNDLSGKAECKAALQAEFGLPVTPDLPLIAFSSRLSPQKGIQELFSPGSSSAYALCTDMAIQFIAAGTGEDWCERELAALGSTLVNFRGKAQYGPELSHRILAGADFILMPHRFEPCGHNQMRAMRYGTLPVARRTGGLSDTVRIYNQDSGDGTGFLFDDLSPRSIYDTVGWAVWAWYNRRDHIDSMRLRAMSQDFSWKDPAREYASFFENALDRRGITWQ
jgi:starch synthase